MRMPGAVVMRWPFREIANECLSKQLKHHISLAAIRAVHFAFPFLNSIIYA
jgi:hypothetical protein